MACCHGVVLISLWLFSIVLSRFHCIVAFFHCVVPISLYCGFIHCVVPISLCCGLFPLCCANLVVAFFSCVDFVMLRLVSIVLC